MQLITKENMLFLFKKLTTIILMFNFKQNYAVYIIVKGAFSCRGQGVQSGRVNSCRCSGQASVLMTRVIPYSVSF